MDEADKTVLLRAARSADWDKVKYVGGPPCFHVMEFMQTFCLNNKAWIGHEHSSAGAHKFVSLADLLSKVIK